MNFTPGREDETQLDESYRHILDDAPDAIFILRDIRHFHFVNRRGADMFGYDIQEIMDMPLDNLFPPGFAYDLFPVEPNTECQLIETVLHGKDGKVFHAEANCRRRADGSVIIILRDITDRKFFEENHRVSERNLRHALTSTANIFYVIDRYGKVTLINEDAENILAKIWGKPVTTGTNILELIPPEREQIVLSSLQKVFSGESVEYELEISKPGVPAWILATYAPVRNESGEITGAAIVTKDITARKHAEEELRRSESRFEMISRTTNDAVWDWDLETGKLWSNETHQLLYGLTLEDPVPSEEAWAARIHPDDRDAVVGTQQRILASDKNVFISEYRFFTEAAGYRHLYDRCYIVRNESGKAIRMMGSMMDVTDQKAFEQKLRKSEEKYRTLFEQASDFILITDREGNFLEINRNFRNTFGYSQEEVVGKSVISIFAPGEIEREPSKLKELKVGQSIISTRKTVTKNGNIIEVEANAKMLEDGRILIIARDIGERKKAEQAIRTSEETRKLIMHAAIDAIICTNIEGYVTVWTPQAERIFGWTEEEIIGRNLSETIIPERYREHHKRGIRRYLETGEKKMIDRLVEISAITKDGKEFPVELRISAIDQGDTRFFCAYVRDISERVKAEQEVAHSNARFQIVSKATSDIVWDWTLDEDGFWWNDNYFSSLGYDREGDIVSVQDWFDHIHPDDLERVRTKVYEVLASRETSWRDEYRYAKADGTYLDFLDRGFIIRDADGTAKRMIGSMVDMTPIYEAQRQVQYSENRLRTILDTDPECIKLLGPDCVLIDINKGGLAMLELESADPVRGKSLLPYVGESFKESISNLVQNAFSGQSGMMEFEMITKSGTRKWCEIRVVPFRDANEEITFALALTIDNSARRAAELELKQSEEKYRTLVESAGDAIALYDAGGKILDVNTGAVNLLGYSKEELANMTLKEVLTPEEFTYNPIRYDLLENGESTVKFRKMMRKNGTIVQTEVRSQQLADGRYLSVIRDLSERVRTKEELEASYRSIRELTAHLQNIREEERAHIAREIHDELGQQLTVLKMDVSWINKKILDMADETTKEKMKELLSMLDDTVRTVRRISSELRPSLLDDLGLVAAMEWQLKEFEKRSGIKTRILAPENELELSNPVKTALFRIFQESLTNVARHSKGRNVTVTLSQEPSHFVLSIEDDGIGFEKELVAEKKTLGILGMTERTTMIGGRYEITSAPGKGTCVSVTVPLP